MSQTIELLPQPQVNSTQYRRAILALSIAVVLHVILLALPISLKPDLTPRRPPLHLTITSPPAPRMAPAVDPVAEAAEARSPAKPEPPTKTTIFPDTTRQRTAPKETIRTEEQPRAPEKDNQQIADHPLEPTAPESGAKSRSTVFDPRLAGKLARKRNKVKKFKSGNTEFITANGTFIQSGDSCAEIRELFTLDIDSSVSQSFKIKCTKRRRSKEDIDRLARKYGIP